MIESVGLVNSGNQRFVDSAYEVYSDAIRAAERFKSTFARNVKVHFVGVWDTAPSASVIGWKPAPPPVLAESVCIFRHALALDERRVKYLTTGVPPALIRHPEIEKDESASIESTETKVAIAAGKSATGSPVKFFRRQSGLTFTQPGSEKHMKNIKEVWFPGTHAEIGEGLKPDIAYNLSSVPLSWMENEAAAAGLRLRSRLPGVKSKWDILREDAGKHSLSALRRLLDWRPTQRGITRTPCRLISRGQQIHACIAFQPKDYRPQADFLDGDRDWQNIVGHNAERLDFDWALKFGDQLEMDFFDASCTMEAVRSLSDVWNKGEQSEREYFWVERLSFMALSGNLCTTYLSMPAPVWHDDIEVELRCAVKFFKKLADQQPAIFTGDLAEILEARGRLSHALTKGEQEVLFEEALCLRRGAAAVPIDTCLRSYKLAASLVLNGSHAIVMNKPQKALYFFDESVDVLRQLLAEGYYRAFPLFSHLQRNLAACLKSLSHDSSALRLAETVVSVSRAIARGHPQYSSVLAAALHDLAFGFPRSQSSQEPNAAEESINMYRNLAAEDPLAHELLVSGQHEKAHCASIEETQIRRKLKEPDGLASSLEQLSRCLNATGQIKAAADTAEESVRIRRKLAEEDGTLQHEMRLADSLHNLSCCLSRATGRTQDALHAAQEAVSIQRGLPKDTALATFNLRLAVFLHNFSLSLSEVGRHAEALRAAEEVMQIRVSWGNDSDCALALSRLASCLSAVGKPDEALGIAEKCFDLAHSVVIADRAHKSEIQKTETQLAETLFSLSSCFAGSKALQAAEESVALYRKLVKCHSATLSTALTRALLQFSTLLVSTGQLDEAERVAAEAVHVGSGLGKDLLSQCFYHLSICLYAVGKEQQGMRPAQRCVELRRRLVEEHGTWQFKEQLADALFNLSLYPSHPPSLGAFQAVREAVSLQRDLADHILVEKVNRRLVDGLQNLAARALIAGEYEEALTCAEEAVGRARKLVEINPSLHTPSFVNILYTHANVLCEYARYEEGYSAITESDGLRQDVCGDSMIATLEASAAYMSTRARCLIGLGRRSEGVYGLLEAIRLYRTALENPSYTSMFESFPWFLNNALACISSLGRTSADALNATADVVELSRLLTEYCPEPCDHYLKLSLEFHVGSLSGK
ncbi:hypothetical protein GGX14DRAFT_459680 [Mycena pura]|uniref:T6SS Phospholipase effector Tle1-like catalytic domain-containing protein n=1 Tax=Mycena pura TaxID=153505 RepID=A0AAD6VEF3_9AGAR|nr:hypothetical protein GGX14DRAFT_459680 [Mycena pura]